MALSTTNGNPLSEDKELSGKLKCHGRDITKLLGRGKDVLFRLSYELFLARNTCLEHNSEKGFGQWVEKLGISRSNAYRAIARWEALAPRILGTPSSGVDCPIVGQPKFEAFLCFAKFDDSALDTLAKPSAPAKAVNAAVKIARSGKGMTKKEATSLVEKHTRPKPPKSVDEPIDVDSEPATPAQVQEAVESAAAEDAEPEDLGKCPVCAKDNWKETDDGWTCDTPKCGHPHGESTGGPDEDRVKTQRQKTVKTVEALMRAFDDLHTMMAMPEHFGAIQACKVLLKTAKEWK